MKRTALTIGLLVLILLVAIGVRMILAALTGNQYPWYLF